MEKIRVVCKEPNKPYQIKEINNDYHFLQEFVQGLIDMSPLPTDETIDICCNDEFLYNGMEPNIVTPETEGVFCGPLIFMGYNAEDGSSTSLSDEQLAKVTKYIERNQVFNMSVEGAYRYSCVMKDYQASEDALKAEIAKNNPRIKNRLVEFHIKDEDYKEEVYEALAEGKEVRFTRSEYGIKDADNVRRSPGMNVVIEPSDEQREVFENKINSFEDEIGCSFSEYKEAASTVPRGFIKSNLESSLEQIDINSVLEALGVNSKQMGAEM